MIFKRGIAAVLALTCAFSLSSGGLALAVQAEDASAKAAAAAGASASATSDSPGADADSAAAGDDASRADNAADSDSAVETDADPAADSEAAESDNPETAKPGEREIDSPSLMLECIPQTIGYWSSYANAVVYEQVIKPIEDQRMAEKRERVFKEHQADRKKYMKKQVKKAQEKARQAQIDSLEQQGYTFQEERDDGSLVYVKDVDAATMAQIAASAPDGTLTMADIMACTSRAQLVHLLAPVYAKYAAQYGLRYPGVFAVQTIYETLGGIGLSGWVANCAYQDNNLSGLKYASNQIPYGATPGITSSEGDPYAHFPNVEAYIAYAVHLVGSNYLYADSRAHQNTVEEYATSLVSMWVRGVPDYPTEKLYTQEMLNDFYLYGAAAYNLW